MRAVAVVAVLALALAVPRSPALARFPLRADPRPDQRTIHCTNGIEVLVDGITSSRLGRFWKRPYVDITWWESGVPGVGTGLGWTAAHRSRYSIGETVVYDVSRHRVRLHANFTGPTLVEFSLVMKGDPLHVLDVPGKHDLVLGPQHVVSTTILPLR